MGLARPDRSDPNPVPVAVAHRGREVKMDDNTISVTPDGEVHVKVGGRFGFDEAVLCMRDCPHSRKGPMRRVVFDLLGTRHIETAGLGFMLMVKERCHLSRDDAVVLYDHPDVGRMLHLAHFDQKFHLISQRDVPAAGFAPPPASTPERMVDGA